MGYRDGLGNRAVSGVSGTGVDSEWNPGSEKRSEMTARKTRKRLGREAKCRNAL